MMVNEWFYNYTIQGGGRYTHKTITSLTKVWRIQSIKMYQLNKNGGNIQLDRATNSPCKFLIGFKSYKSTMYRNQRINGVNLYNIYKNTI